MIDVFARAYGLDPDFVYSKKSFITVTKMIEMWKDEAEVSDRVSELQKADQEAEERAKQ